MPSWEEIRDDLFQAFLVVSPTPDKEQQERIVEFMQGRGHTMGWNAIR